MVEKHIKHTTVSIPEQLKTDEFRFIKLRGKTKVPQEPDFTKAANFAYDDPALLRHLEKGYNYGILGGQGGFIEIDADHEPLITELKNKLPKTLTIKTPHGGFHKYLKTDDPHTGALLDTIENTNGDRANIGHVTGYGRQVVGPGCSIIENGKELFYTIEEDAPVAEIKWTGLNKILGAFLVTKKQERENDNQEETKYTFTNEKYQNIMDVIANPDDFVDDGDGRYRGFPVFGSHQKTGYFLVYAKTNTWYSHKDEKGGHIPQLVALQEGTITIKESLKGEKWWEAIKIMEEKYGIEIKREGDTVLGEELKLHDTNYYLIIHEKKDGTEEVTGIKHKLFADDLIAIYFFKTLRDTEEVIYYGEGYYHYEGEAIIRAESERVFGEHLNSYRVNEILNHVRRSTYIKREELNNDLWTLNLENGLFNIKTFEFAPHTPDLLTTIRIPLKYDPDATCPKIEKFISEVVYPEHVKLIKEIIGYCLYHDYTYQNWFLLHGEGANGKSRLLSLIGKFLGEENVSSIGLQDLNQRFAPVNLYAKSANVVADMSDADLKRTARLKQLTGGDLITAEPKFKNAFTYFNFAKLIYSCNKVPLTEDKSRAFFRRVIFIPFPNTFTVGKNADERILDKLTTKEELSGLLNVAVAGLKHIMGNGGFSGYLTAEENEELYERASNPVYGFFHDCCEIDVEKYIVKMEFTDAFFEYCKEKKVVPFSEKKFIQEMRLLTRMEDEQKTLENGYRKRVWKGITIKSTAQHTHHTHHFPILKGLVENNSEIVENNNENNNIPKGHLGKKNPVYGVQGVQKNNYAECELCKNLATLSPYNLNGKEIGICENCQKELEEQKTTTTPTTPLICVCGKKFDTQEVLQEHQSKCREFQAMQDKKAREEIKNEELLEDIKKSDVEEVRKIMNELENKQIGDEISVEEVINTASWGGMERQRAEDAVLLMKRDGILFSPSKGVVKFVR